MFLWRSNSIKILYLSYMIFLYLIHFSMIKFYLIFMIRKIILLFYVIANLTWSEFQNNIYDYFFVFNSFQLEQYYCFLCLMTVVLLIYNPGNFSSEGFINIFTILSLFTRRLENQSIHNTIINRIKSRFSWLQKKHKID